MRRVRRCGKRWSPPDQPTVEELAQLEINRRAAVKEMALFDILPPALQHRMREDGYNATDLQKIHQVISDPLKAYETLKQLVDAQEV